MYLTEFPILSQGSESGNWRYFLKTRWAHSGSTLPKQMLRQTGSIGAGLVEQVTLLGV